MKTTTIFIVIMILLSCNKEELTGNDISQLFHLKHKGATMPILVEGNIDSRVIILMLHGGPGSSDRHINKILTSFTDPLEDHYAVAYWDQRMGGSSRQTSSELTLDLMTEDTDKVVDFLKFKFGEDVKIFLLGHSWGGMLGTSYLIEANRQKKIAGWIEVCGAHDIPKTSKEALELMVQIGQEQVDKNINSEKWAPLIKDLESIDTTSISIESAMKINQLSFKAVKNGIEDGLINNEFLSSDESWNTIYHGRFGEFSYTANLSNKIELQKTDLWGHLWADTSAISLTNKLHIISLPSLIMYGKYDFVVPAPQGVDAYNRISTPLADKTMVIFEHSAHFPFDSEVELFLEHLIKFIDAYK